MPTVDGAYSGPKGVHSAYSRIDAFSARGSPFTLQGRARSIEEVGPPAHPRTANPAAAGCVLIAALGLLWPGPGGEVDAATADRALDLPSIPWEGGSDYYARFPNARASGWDRPGFFPISVFLGSADPSIVAQYKDAGVNTLLGVEHDPAEFPISNVTSRGLYAIVQLEPEDRAEDWTSAEVGGDSGVVGWFATDECEMGHSGCTLHDATEAECNARYADPTNPANQDFFRLYANRSECVAVARRNAASCSPLDTTRYQDLDECLELAYPEPPGPPPSQEERRSLRRRELRQRRRADLLVAERDGCPLPAGRPLGCRQVRVYEPGRGRGVRRGRLQQRLEGLAPPTQRPTGPAPTASSRTSSNRLPTRTGARRSAWRSRWPSR
jgi:hypothetical protein